VVISLDVLSKTAQRIHDHSTLRRKWVVINDTGCALQLGNVGILPYHQPAYAYSPEQWEFLSSGDAHLKQAVTAVDVGFVMFDAWGAPVSIPLEVSHLEDLPSDYKFNLRSQWNASEADAISLFTSIAYVRHVRLTDGSIWTADFDLVKSKVGQLNLDGVDLTREKNINTKVEKKG